MSRRGVHPESFDLRAESLIEEYREANAPRRQLIRWWLRRNYCAIDRVLADAEMKGGEKFTCLAVAFQLPPASMITDAISLQPIVRITGFTTDAIAIHLKKHEHKIVRHAVGRTRWRFEFLELGGPLGLRADRKIRSKPTEGFDRKIRSTLPDSTGSFTESFGSATPPEKDRARARRSPSPDLLETIGSADPGPAALAKVEQLAEYVRWHNEEYPKHNLVEGQALRKVVKADDVEAHAVLEMLLDGWTLEDLRPMTVALWTAKASPGDRLGTFIASTNRSLHILKRTATDLQRLVLEERVRVQSSHEPSLAAEWERICDQLGADGLDRSEVGQYFRTCRLTEITDSRVSVWAPTWEQREVIERERARREGLACATLGEALDIAVEKCLPGRRVFWFVGRSTQEVSG